MYSLLTHFRPMFPFYTPWKRPKTGLKWVKLNYLNGTNSIWFYFLLNSYVIFFFSFSWGIADTSLSTNDLQTSFYIHLLTSKTAQYQSTNYKENRYTRAYSKWYYVRPGVVSFEQMLKLSMNLLTSPVVNTFFLASLLAFS